MSEQNRKREAAMRLFGALSGVDEEYLAACEIDTGKAAADTLKAAGDADRGVTDTLKTTEDTGSETARQKLVPFERLGSFVRKYGMAVAAVLCVVVLGVSLAGYQLSGRKAMDSTQNGSMAMLQENAADSAVNQEYGGAPEAAEESEDRNTMTNGSGAADGENIDDLSTRLASKNVLQEEQMQGYEKDSIEQELSLKKELMSQPSETESLMTLEQAREVRVVGGYLPEALPESGSLSVLYGTADEGQERITLGWNIDSENESEDWFYLVIENLGSDQSDWLNDSTVFGADRLTRENVEKILTKDSANTSASGTAEGTLGVLYENQGNYVLLTFYGEASAEEVWEMLNSVGK